MKNSTGYLGEDWSLAPWSSLEENPGVGKSTLLLQMALELPLKTLYISGEESAQQIKMRADRTGIQPQQCYLLAETRTQNIFAHTEKLQPDLLVIDSVQTLHTDYIDSAAGSISQIRESTAELIKFAKETATPILLVGHITKEGSIAGAQASRAYGRRCFTI